MRYLLVDCVTDLEPGRLIAGVKNVTMSEDVFTHHFPQHPVMPGMLILESMVQLGRWLIVTGSDYQCSGLLSEVGQAKFRTYVVPGEQIRVEVTLLGRGGGAVRFRGEAAVNDRPRTLATFTLEEVPLELLEDPADARRLFQMLWMNGDVRRRP